MADRPHYAPAGARHYERHTGCHDCMHCKSAYAQQDQPVLWCNLKGVLPEFPGRSCPEGCSEQVYDNALKAYYTDLEKKATVPWGWCLHWSTNAQPEKNRVEAAYDWF